MLEGLHGHADRVSEIKQQGAFEAARDPQSNVTSEDAQKTAMDQAKASGAQAFVFDPNASAEDKAKQARSRVPPELQGIRKHQTAALASDQDDGKTAGYDLPSPSKSGALPAAPTSPTDAGANGHIEKGEEFEKVGWAPRFGNPGDLDNEGTAADHQTMLESKLDDKFFGDWYHNTGIIIFACLSSWLVAVLGGGLGWVFIVMAFCGTYYRTSIRRVRRNFRDDVSREMAKARLETDNESLEWMNTFLAKFWPIYAPVLCATIISSVDQVLSTSTPAFLDSMRMKFFTLGTKPPRLEHVKSYPKAEDDTVLMDWKFSFTPNDTADLTARQIKNKVNPKVVLEIRVGKAMISKGLDIIVEDFAFSGLMRVKVKLQIPFPHVEKIDICFLGRPTIDYVCKPLGGDTFGFDINFIPGLEGFIQEQIHANLAPMMYDPNVFPIEIAKMLAGNPVDQAVGVLQVTFHGAQGLKNADKFAGTPDPYAIVSINSRDELGKTKIVPGNANPRWNETINVILTSLKDSLTIQVYDYNEYRKDKELGTATFSLDQLHTENIHENLQLEVMANGQARGIVQADVRFFPVLEGAKLPDGTQEPPPESKTGIAKFTIEQAKELDGSKSLIGQLNPYAVLLLNGKEVQTSKKLKRTNNPIFPDATKELLITDRKSAKLGLVIKDDRDLGTDPIIGTYQVKLDDMLELMGKGQEWYSLAGVKTGKAKMLLQWKPVALTGALAGSGGYVTPIGVMRLHFQSAKDLKNLETLGKSDPYIRVMLSGVQKGRTVTFQNNLNPVFDEVIYVPVHSNREKIIAEVMDEETMGKDRSLGSVEIAMADYVRQDEENGGYAVHNVRKPNAATLSLGPRMGARGTLNFTASFFPTLSVVDPEEEDEKDQEEKEKATTNGDASLTSRSRSGTVGTITSMKTATSHERSESTDLKKQLSANEAGQESLMPEKKEPPKVRIGVDDLGQYESGLLVFKILEANMAHTNCYLEIIMDDNVFPAYTSAKARTKTFAFNDVGDAMVRELDFSRTTLRLVGEIDKKGDGKEDENVRAKLSGETVSILKRALNTPTQLSLKDASGHESKVTISLRYLPVKMTLDPSESMNNSGSLRVEVLDAADLPAADRNGYSDPYCRFTLQGKEVYKTKTQKKTLHPAWNEFFEVPIRSRTAGNFQVDVYDWDIGGSSDFLGKAIINLDILEPFQKQEIVLGLDGKSGTIRLSMLFKPDYVTRSRQGSSTFSGTFSTPGKIVGAPVKGVGKGAVFVGGGMAKGASFLGRGFKGKKNKDGSEDPVSPTMNGDDTNGTFATNGSAGTAPAIVMGSPSSADKELPATPQHGNTSAAAGTPGSAASGTADIHVLSASGYPTGIKVEVRILHDSTKGLKEVLKTKPIKTKTGDVAWEDESTKVPCTADSQFRIAVYKHATFGSDDLGESTFYVNGQGVGGEQSVSVGSGTVVIRTGFVVGTGLSAAGANSDGASIVGSIQGSPASKSALRRSFLSKRERSVTPG